MEPRKNSTLIGLNVLEREINFSKTYLFFRKNRY